jgi:hypothetical protein
MDSGAADRRQGGNGPAHLDGKPVLEQPKPPPAAAPGGKTKYGLQFGGADGSGMGKKGTEEKRGGRSSCGGRDWWRRNHVAGRGGRDEFGRRIKTNRRVTSKLLSSIEINISWKICEEEELDQWAYDPFLTGHIKVSSLSFLTCYLFTVPFLLWSHLHHIIPSSLRPPSVTRLPPAVETVPQSLATPPCRHLSLVYHRPTSEPFYPHWRRPSLTTPKSNIELGRCRHRRR